MNAVINYPISHVSLHIQNHTPSHYRAKQKPGCRLLERVPILTPVDEADAAPVLLTPALMLPDAVVASVSALPSAEAATIVLGTSLLFSSKRRSNNRARKRTLDIR